MPYALEPEVADDVTVDAREGGKWNIGKEKNEGGRKKNEKKNTFSIEKKPTFHWVKIKIKQKPKYKISLFSNKWTNKILTT